MEPLRVPPNPIFVASPLSLRDDLASEYVCSLIYSIHVRACRIYEFMWNSRANFKAVNAYDKTMVYDKKDNSD